MAALILMNGQKGYRSALPHSRVMMHQPLGAAQLMTAADFEVTAKELARTKEELFMFIADCTGKSIAQISEDCDRDKLPEKHVW
ncbi:MAG: ATP-dependent Clp protease proteolytic subunit [Spirochaetales bacterium]|nr:ATP-dependent Clp protease proteolytic subunit [Spirochaetales bacterium]